MFFGYEPWKYVSTRDELSAHLRKLWEKMDREKYSSNWSDREYHKYTMTIKPVREIIANPAGSDVPFGEVKNPKIQTTFGNPGSKM